MSTLARIIYEETGLTESGTPDEYEEVAAACRRFAMHDTETTDDTDDTALLRQAMESDTALLRQALDAMEGITYWDNEKPEWKDVHDTIAVLRERLGEQQ